MVTHQEANKTPLVGPTLISCAKANALAGEVITTQRCGYGKNVAGCMAALKVACAEAGLEFNDLKDLITDQQQIKKSGGIAIAPESPSQL